MIQITLVQIKPETPFQSTLLPLLSLERREKILKYKNTEDKKRSMLAELLIRKAAVNFCGLTPDQIKICYNPYEKPYIANLRHFKFNISYSGKYVAIATSKYKVGVDIEQIQNIDLDIAERCFTPGEYAYICNCKDPKAAFYQMWTLKESYIKAIGKGLHLPLNAFEIKIDNQTAFLKSYNKYNLMFTYMQLDKYMLALCHQERITNPAITLVHESDFYDYFRTWI